jgi:hypothetical protein
MGHQHDGRTQEMIRLVLRYSRYALASLAVVGFSWNN